MSYLYLWKTDHSVDIFFKIKLAFSTESFHQTTESVSQFSSRLNKDHWHSTGELVLYLLAIIFSDHESLPNTVAACSILADTFVGFQLASIQCRKSRLVSTHYTYSSNSTNPPAP